MDSTPCSSKCFNSLVILGTRKCPISYSPSITREDFSQEAINLFSDAEELKFMEPSEVVLQIKSEEWKDDFIDVLEGNSIPDRSVLQITRDVQPKQQPEVQFFLCLCMTSARITS